MKKCFINLFNKNKQNNYKLKQEIIQMTNYEIIDVPNFKNYIQQEVSKNKIVIHGTAGGTYTGALQTFISGAKGVSTHFIISEDAKIYRLFPQKYFSYHAGSNFRTISQTSFGIEIVNWLSLKKVNNKYYTWTNKIIDPSRVKTTEEWRGVKYWHTITLQQYNALQFLLKYLCQKYNIRKKFFRNYNPNAEFNTKQFTGILQHSSFHPTKLDFQPSIIPKISI